MLCIGDGRGGALGVRILRKLLVGLLRVGRLRVRGGVFRGGRGRREVGVDRLLRQQGRRG